MIRQRKAGPIRKRYAVLLAGTASVLLVTAANVARPPVLIWNASPSVPRGLYRVTAAPIARHHLVLLKLPADNAVFERGYLPSAAHLLKPIAGVAGDRVCRLGSRVTINRRTIAVARSNDGTGRALPLWRGCHVLRHHEIFVLAATPGSFDGRYFGVLTSDAIVGRAEPIWTIKDR